jgi:cytochrome c-type biogenesis protein CcmH/NrfF
MDVLWVVPVVVLALGAVAIVALVRGAAEEGRALMADISRFGELHIALARVNRELVRSRRIVDELRNR